MSSAGVRWHATDASRWLVGPAATNARVRLLCIPYAGGAPSAYRPWSSLLPGNVELLVAQLPGRESRYGEAPLERSDAVVDGLMAALEPLHPLPLILFGHSMGALLAYELAQRLQALAAPLPDLLVVSGHGSPLEPANYRELPDVDAKDFADTIAQRYGGIPTQLLAEPSLLQFFLPLLRSDFRLVANHEPRPRPPLNIPLLAIGGNADPHVSPHDLRMWEHCTRAGFSFHEFPGDHFYLASQAQAVIATLLKTWRQVGAFSKELAPEN